jgi:hypothetical protein
MAKISKKKKVVATATAALVAVSLAIGGSVLVPKKSVQNVVPPIEQVAIKEQTPVPSATPKPLPSKTPKATPKPTKAPAVEVKVTPTPAPLTTLELFGISGNTIVEGTYSIKKVDRNKSELSIDIPKSLNADLYELYLNGQYVDKQLLPNGRILAPPLIFTVPELIELRIFKLQEVIAVGKLKDGKLTIAVKDGVISE